jgi:hypothetical protein
VEQSKAEIAAQTRPLRGELGVAGRWYRPQLSAMGTTRRSSSRTVQYRVPEGKSTGKARVCISGALTDCATTRPRATPREYERPNANEEHSHHVTPHR